MVSDKKKINVKQGYCKCSTLVVTENATEVKNEISAEKVEVSSSDANVTLGGNTEYKDVAIEGSNTEVKVEEGAKVEYSIVMPGTVIKKGAVVQYSIVAENAVIDEGAVVGESPENMANVEDWGVAVVGNGVHIGKGAKVEPKAMVDTDMGGAQ